MRLPLLIVPLAFGILAPASRPGGIVPRQVGSAEQPTASEEAFESPRPVQESVEVYRVLLMRAAPGRLLELIDLLRDRRAVWESAGEAMPAIMRHSQGDHWDLMLLFPVGSLEAYYSAERSARRENAGAAAGLPEPAYERRLRELLSWREELFAEGPTREVLAEYDAGTDLYHIEMFLALPGTYDELVEQRHMENRYYKLTDRRGNLVFTRVGGAAWDVFTIGFYRDMGHFAEEPDLPDEAFEAAAVEAGFEARNRIGTYLRTLMSSHHDTLATAVR